MSFFGKYSCLKSDIKNWYQSIIESEQSNRWLRLTEALTERNAKGLISKQTRA